jgi:homoserine dehydrogenase
VARAFKREGRIFAFVIPQFVRLDNILASVRNEYNAVLVEGAFAEKQVFIGKGAGSYPTGSAVLSDVSALTFDYRYEYKKFRQGEGLPFSNDLLLDVVVSFPAGKLISHQDFEEFKGGYQGNGHHYLTGTVTLEKIKEWSDWEGVSVILAPSEEVNIKQKGSEAELLSA